jgi:hypothetical protein
VILGYTAAATNHKELLMCWFWYCYLKRAATHRHAAVGMNRDLHNLLMRIFYPL